MALPDGITTCTVTAGVPVTHTGGPVKAFVSIEPSAFLVHTATGTPLVDFLEEVSINEGVAGQFTLPHTDQAGFQDENGNAYTNWYYTARISYSTPSKAKTKAPKIKVFQLATGQTLVDLDQLPGGAPALPYTAPIATVTSFSGRTGPVELLDADLPERLSDTSLSATYQDRAGALSMFAQPDLLSFVTLGDSRTAYNGSVTTANPGESAVYTADRGYVSWAMLLLRKRMRWLANGGKGGDTVAQMLARTDALLGLNPGWLIGFGHINSVSANVSAASIITDLTAIFDKCANKGVRVVWGTDWVDAPKTTAQRAVAYTVNEWLRKQVGVRRGFYLADYQAVFVDPSTGNPLAAYASDGLHQDGVGPRVLADQLVKVLEPLIPRQDRLIASNDDKTNLIANGMMVGGATYATTWGQNGTASQGVASKVARADGFPGEWQQVAVTSGTDYSLRYRIAAGTADSWAIGDVVYAECEFETDAAGWAATEFNLNLVLFNTPAGTVTRAADMLHVNGSPASPSRPASGIFRTPPLTIVAGNTHLELNVALKGSGTYRIARAAIKRV